MLEAVSMEKAQAFDRLRMILVGKEKSGKSRTAATARKPILFLDYDKRRESIAGLKDVYALTFTDPQYPMQPTAYADTITVMTALEQGQDLQGLGFKDAPQGAKVKTLVCDSLSSFARCAMQYALYSNSDIRRSISVGGTQIYTAGGWDAWGAEMGMIEQVLMRQLGLPGIDIIWTFHEAEEQMAGSTPDKPVYTGRVAIWPNRYRGLQKFFNEVWRVSREQGNIPTVQVIPDYRFTAATNLDFSKIPANEMRPDIEYLIKRSLDGKK